jgi:hypothetical protein
MENTVRKKNKKKQTNKKKQKPKNKASFLCTGAAERKKGPKQKQSKEASPNKASKNIIIVVAPFVKVRGHLLFTRNRSEGKRQ